MSIHWRAAIVGAMLMSPLPATAQRAWTAGVEAATDERRRGLSWSGGRASASADVAASLGGLGLSARAAAVRGSARHGGADAAIDLAVATRRSLGPFDLEGRVRAHLFAGGSGPLDYYEVGGGISYALGPLALDAGLDLAPSQRAIGGSNLYLYAGATAGLPGTPLTLVVGAGRTSGSDRDPLRAGRLRPERRYHDWRIGVDHVRGPLTLGLDYVGTDVDAAAGAGPFADRRHAGDRLLARARLAF